MADFKIAYKRTKSFEGGYSDVAGDAGGRTYAGITYRDYPGWSGWPTVFAKDRKHNEVIPELEHAVEEFYRGEFWNRIQGNAIVDQEIANGVYDMAVNAGHRTAIKLAQKTAGVPETGTMDVHTLNALNGIA